VCPPGVHVLEAWPWYSEVRGGGTFKRRGLVEGVEVIGGVALLRD
jgi:hypothetical protein